MRGTCNHAYRPQTGRLDIVKLWLDIVLQAVRNAVVKRLEWLDSNFLAALNAYLAAPSVQQNRELSDLLATVRNEVLDLVSIICYHQYSACSPQIRDMLPCYQRLDAKMHC